MLPNAKTCMGLQHGFYQLERLGVLAQGQQDLQYKVKCFNNIQKANINIVTDRISLKTVSE